MKLHLWLCGVPAVLHLGGPLVANRVTPFIGGLPFFVAWTIGAVLLTAIVMGIVFRLDPANRRQPPG